MAPTSPVTAARLRMADWYLGEGFAVFSVWPTDEQGRCKCGKPHADGKGNGKHPVPQTGFHAASTDPKAVHTMLSAPVVPNIGLLVPEGCFGWDLDGEDAERIHALEEQLGTLPPTMGHQTPNGRHAIYRWPKGTEPPARILGVVTRWRDSGYLIGAGSRIGDRDYRLLRGESGAPLPIVNFPKAWVEAALAERPAANDTEAGEGYQIPNLVTAGHRYDAIRDYVASRYMRGMTEDETWLGVLHILAPRFTTRLAEAELYERFGRAWDGTSKRLGPPNAEPIHLVTLAEREAKDQTGMDAADLLKLELPPLRWAVQDLIPEGTTILAAPPKVGKSCLVYQVAVEVSLGGELLGRRVEAGSALYLALEDGRRRGQERLLTALAGREMPYGRLEVRWGARRIGKGLEDDLAVWLDEHPDARMVAIDTLQRVRPAGTGRRGAYEVDVEDLSRLQDLFRDRPTALLIVHHARKATSDDFLASVSGTYGLTGSADTIVVIKRTRLEAFGTIIATGRDMPEAEVSVSFDGMLWHAVAPSLTEGRFESAEVYRIIEERGPIFPAAIAEQLDLTRQSVQAMVGRMVERGDVTRTRGGYEITHVILALVPEQAKTDV